MSSQNGRLWQATSVLRQGRSSKTKPATRWSPAQVHTPGEKSAAATRLQNEAELQGQIYNVLSAEQKARLPQVLADMKSRFEARRATWQQQHGAAASAAAGSN